MSEAWTAIVLAGQRPGIDPLASAFGKTYKALIEVGGMTMVERVVRTLLTVSSIGRVVVLAQDLEAFGTVAAALGSGRVAWLASDTGISKAVMEIAGSAVAPWPILVTTADHPLLTSQMVEDFIAGAGDADVALGVVERKVLLRDYPANERTWLKFRDGAYSGANLFALKTGKAVAALALWAHAEQDRKVAWRLFLNFGPWLMIRALTRTIGFGDAVVRAGRRLNLDARVVVLDHAEAAIDVDKLADHRLAEAVLARRSVAERA